MGPKLREKNEAGVVTSEMYAVASGRMFGAWIDADSRDNGYNAGNIIENPAYIIESILRDEMGLTSSQIDFASFDIVGNTTNGKRNGWKFARSLVQQDTTLSILSRLCYESHCMLFESSNGKYKLVALDTDTTTPYLIQQNQMAREPYVSRIYGIKNKFNVHYRYDYSTNGFLEGISADELNTIPSAYNGFDRTTFTPNESSGLDYYSGANGTSPYASLVYASQQRYKIVSALEESLLWVNDTITAIAWTKKMIEWLYAPRLTLDILGWWGDSASSSRKHLLSYELGDQVRVTHPLLNPTVSNNHIFMVVRKSIDKNEKLVNLNLLQMR